MLRRLTFAILLLCPAPAFADTDELQPVPAFVVMGHSYVGDSAPSVIRFINARYRSVALTWIIFDGREQRYAIIAPGGEVIQPTYVAHRWLVKDAADGTPLQGFISTRSAARDNGAWQIALIR